MFKVRLVVALLAFLFVAPVVADQPRRQEIVYARWLSLEGFEWEHGILSVIVKAQPDTLCAPPPGIIWALGPFSPAVEVYSLGDGLWKFSKIQPATAYTLGGVFADECGIVYHSNTLEFQYR